MTAEDILSKYDEQTATVAFQLREFILSQLKGALEITDPSANLVGYGYGAGYKDTICTILLSKKGIKPGFYKGSELHDPEKLLTGTGKVHKYVEIKNESFIKSKVLKELMSTAFNAYQKRKNQS